MKDAQHVERITQALTDAFTDTDCTLTDIDVKALADRLWRDTIDAAMRAQYVKAREGR